MKEKDLESAVKDSMFKADGKIHQQERDVSKFWKNGEIRISILGFENQTNPDKDMPLRVISYDGASYKQQLLDKKQNSVILLQLSFCISEQKENGLLQKIFLVALRFQKNLNLL